MKRKTTKSRLILAMMLMLGQFTGLSYAQEKSATKDKSKLKVTFRSDNKNKAKIRLKAPQASKPSTSKTTTVKKSPKITSPRNSGSSVQLNRIQRTPSGKLDATNLTKQLKAGKPQANKPSTSKKTILKKTPKGIARKSSAPSVQLNRIQRTATGKLDATNLTKQLDAGKRQAGKFSSPKLSDVATKKRPTTKLNSSSTKRFGGKFSAPKLSDMATKKRPTTKLNSSSTKRFGGKFSAPKLSDMATKKRPTAKLNSSSTKRFAGKFSTPKLSDMANNKRPNTKLKSSGKKLPSKSKYPIGGKTLGKGLGALAIAGAGSSGLKSIKNAKDDYKKGKLSKSDYKKAQKKNVTETAGKLYKLKKLNPTALLMNDVVGTDPISLGVDATLDLINGTDNAKQSLKNVKNSWNKSLTKQVFTDPKGAGKRVANGAKKAGESVKKGAKKVGNSVKKGAKKVGDFFKKPFSKKKKRK